MGGRLSGVAPQLGGGGAAFQVVLPEEGLDRVGVGIAPPVPEADFLAVGEEDIRDIQFLGVGYGLLSRLDGIGGSPEKLES